MGLDGQLLLKFSFINIVPYNLTHSIHCTFSLPGIATQSTDAGLLGILKEIPAYGICGLYAKHNLVYNVFWHEPFLVDSLNRPVLEENRSIKADLETFL